MTTAAIGVLERLRAELVEDRRVYWEAAEVEPSRMDAAFHMGSVAAVDVALAHLDAIEGGDL